MDNDDVTVLMIWNGAGVLNKWQLPGVISALKRKRGDVEDDVKDDLKDDVKDEWQQNKKAVKSVKG